MEYNMAKTWNQLTKNKILFIVPGFVVGGADIFNLNLIKGLRESIDKK